MGVRVQAPKRIAPRPTRTCAIARRPHIRDRSMSSGGGVSRVRRDETDTLMSSSSDFVPPLLSEDVLQKIFDAALPEMPLETVCELSGTCKMFRKLTARWRRTLRAMSMSAVRPSAQDDEVSHNLAVSSHRGAMWHSLLWGHHEKHHQRQTTSGGGVDHQATVATRSHTLAQATLLSELRTWAHPGRSHAQATSSHHPTTAAHPMLHIKRLRNEIADIFVTSENVVCWIGRRRRKRD